MLSIGETANALGVSVRTLRHWEAQGLVAPKRAAASRYRLYDDAALSRLHAIQFYRELGFSLADIARMLKDPAFDFTESLRRHRDLLQMKRKRLDDIIGMVEAAMEGRTMKTVKTTLKDIQQAKAQYAKEARERWGHTEAFKQSAERQLTEEQQLSAAQQADAIFAAFAAQVGQAPADAEVQALVKRWQEHITAHHYPCSREILAGLGEMYTADERFTTNLDRFGSGTAQLMRDAIRVYCQE